MELRVYKPTAKGLRKSGEMESTDRYLFTGPTSALIYNADTLNILEPFGHKSKDCYVEATDEPVPDELFVESSLIQMYGLDKIMTVQKILEIKFTKS